MSFNFEEEINNNEHINPYKFIKAKFTFCINASYLGITKRDILNTISSFNVYDSHIKKFNKNYYTLSCVFTNIKDLENCIKSRFRFQKDDKVSMTLSFLLHNILIDFNKCEYNTIDINFLTDISFNIKSVKFKDIIVSNEFNINIPYSIQRPFIFFEKCNINHLNVSIASDIYHKKIKENLSLKCLNDLIKYTN